MSRPISVPSRTITKTIYKPKVFFSYNQTNCVKVAEEKPVLNDATFISGMKTSVNNSVQKSQVLVPGTIVCTKQA